MLRHALFGLAICMVSTAYSQTLKVSGTVKDAANRPIANAIVELLRAKLKDTTGADGAYSLNVTPNALGRAPVSRSVEISLQNGILELATTEAAPLQVEILDIQGNRLNRMALGMVSAGTYRLNLAQRFRSRNLVIVKASVGRTTKAFPYVPANFGAAPADFSPDFPAQAGARLAKVSAALDTLLFTASGYASKKVELNSADTTINATLEASGDYWGGLKNPPGKSAGCGKAAMLTSGRKTITSRGRQREYIIDVPADYDMNKPYRLFYCTHGLGGLAEHVTGNNYYGLKPLANAANEPAVFFSPQAIDRWDETDHTLFDELTTLAKNGLCIDTTRVFATGMSYGGMYTYSISTTKQKRIRAGVGLAPTNFNIYLPNPKLKEPIAWMHTTGMGDNICAWDAGSNRGSKYIALEKAADNGCAIPTEIPTWKSGAHVCYDFQGCRAGYPVKTCTFNGGHVDSNRDPGSNVNWIAQESWKFFSQF